MYAQQTTSLQPCVHRHSSGSRHGRAAAAARRHNTIDATTAATASGDANNSPAAAHRDAPRVTSASGKAQEALSLFANVRARLEAAATLHTHIAPAPQPPPLSSSAAARRHEGAHENDDDNAAQLREQLRSSNALVQRLYDRNKSLTRRVTQLEHECAVLQRQRDDGSTVDKCHEKMCSSSNGSSSSNNHTAQGRSLRDVACSTGTAVGVQADALMHTQSCLRELQSRFDALLRVQVAAVLREAADKDGAGRGGNNNARSGTQRTRATPDGATYTARINAEVSKLFAVMRDTIAAQAAQHEQERARMNAALYSLERQLASLATSA